MPRYRIESSAGKQYGIWDGRTEADALVAMHRDAGYSKDVVWVRNGKVYFIDEKIKKLLGGLDEWDVREV